MSIGTYIISEYNNLFNYFEISIDFDKTSSFFVVGDAEGKLYLYINPLYVCYKLLQRGWG